MDKVNVAFVSNYYNHHQKPFCDEISNIVGKDNFVFIETSPIPQNRIKLGYPVLKDEYVLRSHESIENEKRAKSIINDCDILIFGQADKRLLEQRYKTNKITFFYSERLFKKGLEPLKYIYRYFKLRQFINKKSNYLLCSSAFACEDYNTFGLFKNKCYKWGYFSRPPIVEDFESLFAIKKPNTLLWCGRFLKLKRPMDAVLCVEKIVKQGKQVSLKMIGDGDLYDEIKEYVINHGLTNFISVIGQISSSMVFEEMKKASILLFTSDFNEGWGAVLGEAMTFGCVPVASHACGSSPFLINDRNNGFIYRCGNIDEMSERVSCLIDNPDIVFQMAKNAYLNLNQIWSPKNAARRFLELSQAILNNSENPYIDGPCSYAKRLKNNWYK